MLKIYSALRQRSKSAHNGTSRVRYKLPLLSFETESLESKVMTKSLKEILSNHFTNEKLSNAEGSIRQRRDIKPNGKTHLS